MRNPERIIISRTDSIGDVVLTLPVAGVLKERFPGVEILFLGRSYTKAVIECSVHVDRFLNYDDFEKLDISEAVEKLKEIKADTIIHVFPRPKIARLAKRAGIKQRIGTTGRIYHWLTCNKLVSMSRKRSDLHEAQLNIKLLKPFGITTIPELNRIPAYYGFEKIPSQTGSIVPTEGKRNVIIHPGSRGSGREWGLENFSRLAGLMNSEKYSVYLSGTKEEGSRYGKLLEENPHIINLCGKLSLPEFIKFISECNALVASSTGPLHIAAATGIHALGIYAPMRPIHPGRWAPIGSNAHYFVVDRSCEDCRKTLDCHCMREIRPAEVMGYLENVL